MTNPLLVYVSVLAKTILQYPPKVDLDRLLNMNLRYSHTDLQEVTFAWLARFTKPLNPETFPVLDGDCALRWICPMAFPGTFFV